MSRMLLLISCIILFVSCENKSGGTPPRSTLNTLVNTNHLQHLYTNVTFPNGVKAAGIYIYAEAPDYHLVGDDDEGYTCVDDVSRAALIYLRNKDFLTDISIQDTAFSLIRFILQMQSPTGYFYNFLFAGDSINTTGSTSSNTANWWSWRALQTLSEASSLLKKTNASLAKETDSSINRLLSSIKSGIATVPQISKSVKGISVPQWLPAGSASDQAAILIIALVNSNSSLRDPEIDNLIRRLADGIIEMQHGTSKEFPYSCFLSWENVWHAYGCDQAFALMKAGKYFNDSSYIQKALSEVDNFYPWLLKNEMLSSFSILKNNGYVIADKKNFPQIAYGLCPMIFAAAEAYEVTGAAKYATLAGQLAAWFFGLNDANEIMYDSISGRCYDGIIDTNKVNRNSGAESTIECLLALQKIENYPAIISALNKYRKNNSAIK